MTTTPTIERYAENETHTLARQDARLIKKGKSPGFLTVANVAFELRQRGFGDDESITAAAAVIAKANQPAKASAATTSQRRPAQRPYGHEGSWCWHCAGPDSTGRGDCGECR